MDIRAQVTCLAAVIWLAGAIGCMNDEGLHSGQPSEISAASVRLLDLDGSPFDLWNAGQQRVRVVVFTRSDCPVSNRYAPEIRELYGKWQPRGVDFYLVYVDPSEQPDAIQAHLHEFGYPCRALRDPEQTLVSYTQATVTPEAVVFDVEGLITYRGRISDLYVDVGNARSAPTKHDLRDAIEATLSGLPVEEPVTKAIGCYIGDLK